MKNCELAESGILRARHADRAALERLAENSALMFGQIGMAHAGAGRIAGLRHEAVDDAMEDDAVVEAALGQGLDLRDMLWRKIGPQLDRDAAVLGVEIDGVLEVLRGLRRTLREPRRKPSQKP